MLLLALRGLTPLWVTLVLANLAAYLYSVLFYTALTECLGARSRLPLWGAGLLAVGIAGNLYFAYVGPSPTARHLIAIILPGMCAVVSAALTFRIRAIPLRSSLRHTGRRYIISALAWLQVTIVIVAVLRSVLVILYPPSDIMHVDLITMAGSYLNLLLNLASGTNLVWLAFWLQRVELYTRANTDGGTGLLNRRAFDEILVRELNRAQAAGRSLQLMMADIDFFKRVNDTWGHPAGEEVLRHVANVLHQALRPADILSRFGGEESAILLRDSKPRQATEVAERLRAAVASMTNLPEGIRVTISIGLAASLSGEKIEDLVARCDQALYRSKREGRNRVTIAGDSKDGEPAVAPSAPLIVRSTETQRSA
jgi:diguanylate cyclase (GGDEF)-like protein